MPKLRGFFGFINERHRIHLRRQAGKRWPWTKDPTLQKFRFCEVFRELDKTTIWIRKNWREPYADHPNLWFAMCVARRINWPPTLEEIGFPDPWRPKRALEVLEDRIARGEKAFSSAYRLGKVPEGERLPHHTTHNIRHPLFRDPPPLHKAKTLEDAWRLLYGRPGFGGDGFLAYEVITDLRHTRYLKDAPDVMSWAVSGPGARMGLDRIWGRPVLVNSRGDRYSKLPADQALDEMRYLLKVSPDYLGEHVPPLELREIEHSCCEWSKWLHARETGRGKRYRPPEPKHYALV